MSVPPDTSSETQTGMSAPPVNSSEAPTGMPVPPVPVPPVPVPPEKESANMCTPSGALAPLVNPTKHRDRRRFRQPQPTGYADAPFHACIFPDYSTPSTQKWVSATAVLTLRCDARGTNSVVGALVARWPRVMRLCDGAWGWAGRADAALRLCGGVGWDRWFLTVC